MSLGPRELDRLSEDIYKDRVLAGSVYCGNCGYNLRTLPYVYTCPECGQAYNARPLKMVGIFAPHEAVLPLGDAATVVLCGFAAFLFGRPAVRPLDLVRLTPALVFGGFMVVFAWRAYARIRRFVKVRRLARRIALEEAG